MSNYIYAAILFFTGLITIPLTGGDLTVFLFAGMFSVMLVKYERDRQERLRKIRQRLKYSKRSLEGGHRQDGREITETDGICA